MVFKFSSSLVLSVVPCFMSFLFSFGLIADVQYADVEDGENFLKTTIRRFRGSLAALKRAVGWWGKVKLHSKRVKSKTTLETSEDL